MYYAIESLFSSSTAVCVVVADFFFVSIATGSAGTEVSNVFAVDDYTCRSIFDQNGTFIEDELKAGSNIPARIAMIAITTGSVINIFFILSNVRKKTLIVYL